MNDLQLGGRGTTLARSLFACGCLASLLLAMMAQVSAADDRAAEHRTKLGQSVYSGKGLSQASLKSALRYEPLAELRNARREDRAGAASSESPGSQLGQAQADPSAPTDIRLRPRFQLETPRGHAMLEPLPSAGPEAFVRVHAFGAVYAMADAETILWNRTTLSLYEDWGVWSIGVPAVPMGWNPFLPIPDYSENPFAVGDINGDGHDDVAIAHVLFPGLRPPDQWIPFLTVLDGRTGDTIWWKEFPNRASVLHVVAAELDPSPGQELIIGIEGSGEPSRLEAIDLEGAPLVERPLWTFKKGTGARFLHVEAVPGPTDLIAASWSPATFSTPLLGAPQPRGQVVLIDGETGQTRWTTSTTGFPRTFRVDRAGDRLVIQDMFDPWADITTPYLDRRYTLRAISLADGTELASAVRSSAIMLDLEIGNIDADGETEWVATELAVREVDGRLLSTRVSVFEANGSVRWSHEASAEPHMPLLEYYEGVAVAGGADPMVVVAILKGRMEGFPGRDSGLPLDVPAGVVRYTQELLALDADASAPEARWHLEDQGVFPPFVTTGTAEGRAAILIGTEGLGGRAYDPRTGTRFGDLHVIAEPTRVMARDLGGDESKDLLVAAQSGVLTALDGSQLDAATPGALWSTVLDGPIHDVQLGDLTGDSIPEAVVAATRQVAAVNLADGRVLWSYARPPSRPDEVFWTVGVGDVDGDQSGDVVVPGQRLIALEGSTGVTLWEWEPAIQGGDPSNFSSVALADGDGDGALDAAAAYTIDYPKTLAARNVVGNVLVSGQTGEPLWEHRRAMPRLRPRLWRSVLTYSNAQPPYDPRFVFTYDVPSQQDPLGNPNTQIDVISGRNGQPVFSSGRLDHTYMATRMVRSPRGGDEVVAFARSGFAAVANQKPAVETYASEDDGNFNVFDGAFASLVPGEQHVVLGQITGNRMPIAVYPAATTWEPGGANPGPMAQWDDVTRAFGSLEVEIADLEDDGVDEIIALTYDWAGYFAVTYFEGLSHLVLDPTRHGIEILEAIPA